MKSTILLVRGLGRRYQRWLEEVKSEAESRGRYFVDRFNYKFLESFTPLVDRHALRNRVEQFKDVCEKVRQQHPYSQHHAIAHSLGSVILGLALLDDDSPKLDRIILYGSVLPVDYPWNRVQERGLIKEVFNYTGDKDFWCKRIYQHQKLEELDESSLPFPVLDHKLFGASGLVGFSSIPDINRKGACSHSGPQFRAMYQEWLDVLDIRPVGSCLVPIDQVQPPRTGTREIHPVLTNLVSAITDSISADGSHPKRILITGPPGVGKTFDVLLAGKKLEEDGRWGYYLDLKRIKKDGLSKSVEEILKLTPRCVLVLDDLHWNFEDTGRDLLQRIYNEADCALLCVCRSTAIQALADIRTWPWEEIRIDPDSDKHSEDVAGIVRTTLRAQQNTPTIDEVVVQSFVQLFRTNLPALSWALSKWTPGCEVSFDLAREGVKDWLRNTEDFKKAPEGHKTAIALFLAVASFYQYELSVSEDFLCGQSGLAFPVSLLARLSEGCGLIARRESEYSLDHENNARLCLVAGGPYDAGAELDSRLLSILGKLGAKPEAVQAIGFRYGLLAAYAETGFLGEKSLRHVLRYAGYVEDFLRVTRVRSDLLVNLPRHINKRIDALIDLASAHREVGDPDGCESNLDMAEALINNNEMKSDEANVSRGKIYYEKGMVKFLRNEFIEAKSYCDKAVGCYLAVGSGQEQRPAACDINIHTCKVRTAASEFHQSVVGLKYWSHLSPYIFQAPNEAPDSKLLSQLATEIKNNHKWFVEQWQRLEERKREREDSGRWALSSLVLLGAIFLDLNRTSEVKDVLKESDALSKRLKKEGISHGLTLPQMDYLRGRMYLQSGDSKSAYASLKGAANGYRDIKRQEEFASVLLALGDAAYAEGKKTEATQQWQEACKTRDDMCNRRGIVAAQARLEHF